MPQTRRREGRGICPGCGNHRRADTVHIKVVASRRSKGTTTVLRSKSVTVCPRCADRIFPAAARKLPEPWPS